MALSCAQWDSYQKSVVAVEEDRERYIGRFAQVIELYDHSATKTMSLKSKRNMRIVSFRLLEDIQEQEKNIIVEILLFFIVQSLERIE